MPERLGKLEITRMTAEKTGMSIQDSKKYLEAFMDVIKEQMVAGNQINLQGFGVFDITETKSRTGINPKTREPIQIEASRRPKFTPAKLFKDSVKSN